MDVRNVDPRDQVEGIIAPSYRVYFWSRLDADALHSDEYQLSGADVHEVISWAERNACGRTYALFISIPARAGVNLVRLAGWDADASDDIRPAHAVTVPRNHGKEGSS
jgi:hypothetical protein